MAASDKRSAGQPFKPPPHNVWNNMVAAGEQLAAERLGKPRKQDAFVRRTDIIKVRNDSGAARARGEIVCFGGLVTTLPDPLNIVLKSVEPLRGKRFGVLLYEVPEDGIREVQLSGICIARVNVTNVMHRAARVPDDGTYVLESSFSGPCELIWCPDGTGEDDCVIRIIGDSIPIFKTPGGGIPARSGSVAGSANCTPYTIDNDGTLVELKDDDDEVQTVKIYNVFGGSVEGTAYITAKDVLGCLAVDAEDCG